MRSKAHLLKRRMPNAQTRAAMKEARAMQESTGSARFETADELFDNLRNRVIATKNRT